MNHNALLDKYKDFLLVSEYNMCYEFEDGSRLEYKFEKKSFPHLIGLQKLIDIPIINEFNNSKNRKISAGFLIFRIKKERFLTDTIIQASSYFPEIQDRYDNFTRDNLLTVSYTDVIIDFNPILVGSSLKSKYILYEKTYSGYNYLCIAESLKGDAYAETFFHNPTDRYIRNQHILKVKKVRIIDKQGNFYLEDALF